MKHPNILDQLMTVNQIKSKDVSTDKAISRFEYVIQVILVLYFQTSLQLKNSNLN